MERIDKLAAGIHAGNGLRNRCGQGIDDEKRLRAFERWLRFIRRHQRRSDGDRPFRGRREGNALFKQFPESFAARGRDGVGVFEERFGFRSHRRMHGESVGAVQIQFIDEMNASIYSKSEETLEDRVRRNIHTIERHSGTALIHEEGGLFR